MKPSNRSLPAVCCGLLLGALAGPPSAAQSDPERYWPCEQALVEKVPAAVVWAGPAIDRLQQDWRDHPRVSELAHRLAHPRVRAAEGEKLIEEFAATLEPAERDPTLTLLFAATLELLNRDRAKLIRGIKRYSRSQQDRADHLGRLLDEMVELEDDPSDSAKLRLAAIRQTLEIQQRMFDEREKSIPFLCTRPIAVEQKLGRLARAIAYHLD